MFISITLSSLLLYLAYPNFIDKYGFGVVAWFFAVPLLSALNEEPLRKRLLIGCLFGFLTLSLQLNWMISYNILGYIALILALALQPVFFACFYSPQFKNKFLVLLYVPAAWVASEYLRPLLFDGFSWTIGHTQSFSVYPLQIAGLFGSYGISFALILVNFCFYKLMRSTKDKLFYWTVIAVTFLSVWGYGYFSIQGDPSKNKPQDSVTISLVQANVNFEHRLNPDFVDVILDKYIALTQNNLKAEKADLIIWPETAIPDDVLTDQTRNKKLTKLIRKTKTEMLVGSALLRGNQSFNSAVLFDNKGNVKGIYDKRHLVPFSEYTPPKKLFTVLSKMFNVQNDSFIPGEELKMFSLSNDQKSKFGISICSEDAYPDIFRKFSKENSAFAVVLLNDSWFQQPEGLIMHAQHSIVRAAENRLPIIRSSETGWSGSIDKFGRTDSRNTLPLNTKGAALTTISVNGSPTLYSEIGDIFAVFCFGFVIINFVVGTTRKIYKK